MNTTATITRFNQQQTIKVFQPGQRVEHVGRSAAVVRMTTSGSELTGHVVLTDRFGIHWEARANDCYA